jgi:GNAT superfamily N-acetyltransferase
MVTIRPLKESDSLRIIELIKTHMPLQIYSECYFKWKFSYNVNFKNEKLSPLGILAEEEGATIAFACFFPYQLFDGQIIWNVDDVVTHAGYRRKGLFKRVMEYGLQMTDNRNECTYLFSSPMARKGYLSLGYKDKFNLDYFISVPDKIALITKKFLPVPKQTNLNERFESSINKLQKKHGIVLDKIKTFPTDLDNTRWDIKNIFATNSLFLNWRYTSHPVKQYDCYLLRKPSREIVGYIVVTTVNILEFALKEAENIGLLFAFAKAYFAAKQTLVGNVFVHGNGGIISLLKKHGYIKWDLNWRPAGLYEKHTVMVRETAGYQGDLFSGKLFTMGNINCGF